MGALRLYGRGWARTCDYSGTATRSEFWWFTVIHTVFYAGVVLCPLGLVLLLTASSRVSYDFTGLPAAFCIFLAVTLAMLLPWTSLLVRRERDATGSTIAAGILVLVAYGSLIATFWGIVTLTLLLLSLAVLGFLAVAVVSALPSRNG